MAFAITVLCLDHLKNADRGLTSKDIGTSLLTCMRQSV